MVDGALERTAQQHVRWAMEMQRRPELDASTSPNASVNNPRWFDSGGQPTDERADFHAQLLADLIDATPNVGQDRRAVVLAGPPGAGKSRIMTDEDYTANIPGYAPGEFLSIDADYFKERILTRAANDGSLHRDLKPDFIHDLEADGEVFSPLEFASLVHEESSYLAKTAREVCVDNGYNIVVDTVLSSQTSASAIGDLLQSNGYSVSVIDVEIPAEVSKEAVAHRWRSGYIGMLKGEPSQALGGRWVPSEYVDKVFEHGQSQPRRNAELLATAYSNVKNYRVYERDSALADPQLVTDKQRRMIGAELEDMTNTHASQVSNDGSTIMADQHDFENQVADQIAEQQRLVDEDNNRRAVLLDNLPEDVKSGFTLWQPNLSEGHASVGIAKLGTGLPVHIDNYGNVAIEVDDVPQSISADTVAEAFGLSAAETASLIETVQGALDSAASPEAGGTQTAADQSHVSVRTLDTFAVEAGELEAGDWTAHRNLAQQAVEHGFAAELTQDYDNDAETDAALTHSLRFLDPSEVEAFARGIHDEEAPMGGSVSVEQFTPDRPHGFYGQRTPLEDSPVPFDGPGEGNVLLSHGGKESVHSTLSQALETTLRDQNELGWTPPKYSPQFDVNGPLRVDNDSPLLLDSQGNVAAEHVLDAFREVAEADGQRITVATGREDIGSVFKAEFAPDGSWSLGTYNAQNSNAVDGAGPIQSHQVTREMSDALETSVERSGRVDRAEEHRVFDEGRLDAAANPPAPGASTAAMDAIDAQAAGSMEQVLKGRPPGGPQAGLGQADGGTSVSGQQSWSNQADQSAHRFRPTDRGPGGGEGHER